MCSVEELSKHQKEFSKNCYLEQLSEMLYVELVLQEVYLG